MKTKEERNEFLDFIMELIAKQAPEYFGEPLEISLIVKGDENTTSFATNAELENAIETLSDTLVNLELKKAAHFFPEHKCPHCNVKVNGAANPRRPQDAPRPYDLTACVKCGELSVFTDDMALRKLDDDEYNTLPEETKANIKRMQEELRGNECETS